MYRNKFTIKKYVMRALCSKPLFHNFSQSFFHISKLCIIIVCNFKNPDVL